MPRANQSHPRAHATGRADTKLCTYRHYAQGKKLRQYGFKLFPRTNIAECGALLKERKVNAVYMDEPIMKYYYQREWDAATDPPATFARTSEAQMLGVMFPESTKYAYLSDAHDTAPSSMKQVFGAINLEILRFRESDAFAELHQRWFHAGAGVASPRASAPDAHPSECATALLRPFCEEGCFVSFRPPATGNRRHPWRQPSRAQRIKNQNVFIELLKLLA